MLAFNLISHHYEGDLKFMLPLTLLFLVDLGLIVFCITRKNFGPVMLETIKHIALLILVFGIFGSLYGFLSMFDALEAIKEDLPRQIIAGGVKVALLNILYGFGYFCILQVGNIAIRVLSSRQNAA